MNTWNQVPLFRLLPFFIAGIVLAFHHPPADRELVCSLLLLFLLFPLAWRRRQIFRRRWMFGMLTCLLSLAAGRAVVAFHAELRRPDHFSRISTGQFIGVLKEHPVEKSRSMKSLISIRFASADGVWKMAGGSLLVYFQKDSGALALKYGDVIAFQNFVEVVRPPANPGQFDYRRYLGIRNIFHQVYLPAKSWSRLDSGSGHPLVRKAGEFRSQLLDLFRKYGITGQEHAVLAALILGYEDEIDNALVKAYAATGALHVLSVSGLHVGIIYVALNGLLFFLSRNRKLRWLHCIIVLAFLWGYALLTGCSPSVLRSAAMLSFVVVGKALSRRTNTYNTLAASAIVLLALDPGLLMQAGFQLSYLAVTGIVFLYPPMNRIFWFRYALLRAAWSLVAVSLAAQLATFPLGLYYFHQFPNYFLPANLLIIPLSSLIIYGGIFLFAISPFPALAVITGAVLNRLVGLLNILVSKMEALPYAVTDGIVLHEAELLLVYGFLLAAVLIPIRPHRRWPVLALTVVILLAGGHAMKMAGQLHRREIVVYHLPQKSAIDITDGRSGYIVTDPATDSAHRSLFQGYWWQTGAASHELWPQDSTGSGAHLAVHNHWIRFYDKILLCVDSNFVLPRSGTLPAIDLVVVKGNAGKSQAALLQRMNVKRVVVDASNAPWIETEWRKACREAGLAFHSVRQNGAYIFTF